MVHERGPRPMGAAGGTGALPVSSSTRCRTSPCARFPLPPPLPGFCSRRSGGLSLPEEPEESHPHHCPFSAPAENPKLRPAAVGKGGLAARRVCTWGAGSPAAPPGRISRLQFLVFLRCVSVFPFPRSSNRAPVLTRVHVRWPEH